MNITDIINDISSILGNAINTEITASGNGIYEFDFENTGYYIAAVGASKTNSGRSYCQAQRTIKPLIMNTYEKSKEEQKKFFLLAPDSNTFTCGDYYIFIEMLERGGDSSSFEIDPPAQVYDHPYRVAGSNQAGMHIPRYYITYVPALVNGVRSNELLKQYLLSFDSRPFSRYITNTLDIIPSTNTQNSNAESVSRELWPNNFLIAGAPGTGKSYTIDEKAIYAIKKCYFANHAPNNATYSEDDFKTLLLQETGNIYDYEYCFQILCSKFIRRVTFYEDYSYESFVGCYKPVPNVNEDNHFLKIKDQNDNDYLSLEGSTTGNHITYVYESGAFIDTYVDALNDKDNNYFIIIEEINRAKAASVFGDMFQLLDRKDGISEYSIKPEKPLDTYLRDTLGPQLYDGTIKLPKNMFIWATMNNADQGVFPLDSAFKRRWGYMYLDVNSSTKDANLWIGTSKSINWDLFRNYLNKSILKFANEDKCIGAWYFKDEEFNQIHDYFNATQDIRGMINPLSDKLLIYLLNDVCRMEPQLLFNDEYTNMPAIRAALATPGISLEDILRLDWTEINNLQSAITSSNSNPSADLDNDDSQYETTTGSDTTTS